jgi:hypothetical protein
MGWLVGLNATNIYKVWIPHPDRVVVSWDVQVDEKVMYNPQLVTNFPESKTTLSIIINEIDLDETDIELFSTTEDTTISNPNLVQYEVPSGPFPPSQGSFVHTIPREIQSPANRLPLLPYPTPVSLESRQRSMTTENPPEARAGQHIANSVQSHLKARQVRKKARRQAHALRLERVKLGQQIAHAFASARFIRTHQKDLMPPPDFWHQLKRHPEKEGFRCANPSDLQHHISDDIYAATGAYRSFRILMALVCAVGLLCHQIDFKNAFINADMDDEIYTTCPPGYGMPGRVWELLKALYRLRKSPKSCFDELVSFLKGLGFNHCPDEPCILINNKTGLILFLYVDDLLVIARRECIHQINQFKTAVNKRYGIKDLSEAISFINIWILH